MSILEDNSITVPSNVSDTFREYLSDKTIHDLFAEQADKTPEKIAVEFQKRSLSYKELNRQANQLARVLRRKGVEPDSIVALMVERSTDMIVAIMAILKAGGAFLPIDPKFPISRIDYMLSDSRTKLLVTQSYLKVNLCNSFDGDVICLDDNPSMDEDYSNLMQMGRSSNLIYVIYTSGSTGKPKGVMIEHKSVHNFIVGMTDIINFDTDYTIASLTTISFDIFILETLLPLTRGMKIILADPRDLHTHVGNSRIDMLQTTPSTMQLLLNDTKNLSILANLKVVMLGGEPLPLVLLESLREIITTEIYNLYGPTETTIWSSVKDLTHTNEITIGCPIANTTFYTLNEYYLPLNPGEIGELFISGDGVARGYLHKPALMEERFIMVPIGTENVKMYRTGDMVERNVNSEFIFRGRVDNQVKIRGFRIELREIEEYLSRFIGIKECVVTARNNKSGQNYLVAYYTADKPYEASQFIRHLSNFLPEYMIPGFYLHIEAIPLTPNGKIDRRSLPNPDNSRPILETFYVSPTTTIEKKLVDIWRKVLGLDLVGIHDNFFELGGNSILLSVMYAEINKNIHQQLMLPDLFSYPTVERLSEYIAKDLRDTPSTKKLRGVSFPKEYFGNNQIPGNITVLKKTLDENIYRIIKKICKYKNYDLGDFLVGIFTCVISEKCGHKSIDMKVMCTNNNHFISIMIDFDQVNDMEEVFNHFHNCQTHVLEKNFFYLDYMSQVIPDEHLYPIFCDSHYIKEELVRKFGLAAGMRDKESQLELVLSYDNGRLHNQKVKELFTLYIKAIKNITTIYEKRWYI